MDKNLKKILLEQIYLMSYNTKKTLNENKIGSEQKFLIIEGFPTPDEETLKDKEYWDAMKRTWDDADNPNKYPNYCKFKEHAAFPEENAKGASGVEAIPPNYCFYTTVGGGYFLNQLLLDKITVNTLGKIEKMADEIIENNQGGLFDKTALMTKLAELLPIGKISGFIHDKKPYVCQIRSENKGPWVWNGFVNKDNKNEYYLNPELVDMRSTYEYVVDEWGDMIQIGLAIGTAFIPLGGWAFAAEIVIELGIGAALAQRAFEKGENISGWFNILFACLPLLKLSKTFRGVSDEALEKIAKQIADAGLSETSHISEYIAFYNKLDDEGKSIMRKLFDQDEISRKGMVDELTKLMSDAAAAKKIGKNFDEAFKAAAGYGPAQMIAYRLPIFERLWARELSVAGAVMIIQQAVQLTLGQKLDTPNEEEFKWLYLAAGDESDARREMLQNFVTQVESTPEVLDSLNNDPTLQALKEAMPNPEELSDHATPIIDSVLTKVYKEEGEIYYDINGDPKNTDTISVEVGVSPEKLNGYKQLGWKFCKEVPLAEWPKENEINRYKTINDSLYILVYE